MTYLFANYSQKENYSLNTGKRKYSQILQELKLEEIKYTITEDAIISLVNQILQSQEGDRRKDNNLGGCLESLGKLGELLEK